MLLLSVTCFIICKDYYPSESANFFKGEVICLILKALSILWKSYFEHALNDFVKLFYLCVDDLSVSQLYSASFLDLVLANIRKWLAKLGDNFREQGLKLWIHDLNYFILVHG